MICSLAGQESFQPTGPSMAALADLALAASIEAVLADMEIDPDSVSVTASDGHALVRLRGMPRVLAGSDPDFRHHYRDDLARRLRERTRAHPELRGLAVELAD